MVRALPITGLITLVACGSSPPPAPALAGNTAEPTVGVPKCAFDEGWSVALPESGSAGTLVSWNGTAAWADVTSEPTGVVIRHAGTDQLLAGAPVPAATDASATLEAVVETPSGPVVLVSTVVESERYDSPPRFWLLRFDERGAPSRTMLEVPRRVIEEPQLVAVGDQLVFFARHENDDLDDVGYVAILDSAGKLVREVSAPDAWHVAPIGPSTFGVVMTPDGEITVRVFDTQRLDWRGPATSLDYFVDVSVSVNGTALLHGESESLSSDEPVITRIATLDSAGHVSPWQDIAGDSRLLVNDGSAYLITHADDDWLSVDRIDDELTRRPAATSVSLADGAFVENPVMADDGLYLVGYRALRRFSCQTAK